MLVHYISHVVNSFSFEFNVSSTKRSSLHFLLGGSEFSNLCRTVQKVFGLTTRREKFMLLKVEMTKFWIFKKNQDNFNVQSSSTW